MIGNETGSVAIAIANAFERAGYPTSLAKYCGMDAVLVGDQTTTLPPILGDVDGEIPLEHAGVWCRIAVEPDVKSVVLDVVYKANSDTQRVLAETIPESVADAVREVNTGIGYRGTRTSEQSLANLSIVLDAVERKREPLAQGDLIPLIGRLGSHFQQSGMMGQAN